MEQALIKIWHISQLIHSNVFSFCLTDVVSQIVYVIHFIVSEAGVKRKKRKLSVMTSYTGTGSASVSQLLAQRDKERSKEATLHPQQVNKTAFNYLC